MNEESTSPFRDDEAARTIGKLVLVGVTYVDEAGELLEQVQFHGVVECAERDRGFAIRRADTGQLEWLPPDPQAFRPAEPGEYRLRSSGEVVVDPDFLSTWTVERDA